VIAGEASRALEEMRAIVRILRRDDSAALEPTPRIADLERLGTAASAEGPAIEVDLSGELDGVTPPVSAAVYRLAQESVTNAQRHARNARRIEVMVTADHASVYLRVSDDGDPAPVRAAGPGFGLMGMRERAELLGGTCQAGPNPQRGWTVTAALPRKGPPP
jgi:signal transduction histidine kinase